MISEHDIIDGLRSGHESAYQYLYKHYYRMLCVFAYEFTKNTVDAAMIVSDVICAIWENRERLEIHTSLKGYLTVSVRNRCLNFLAQTARRQGMIDGLETDMKFNKPHDENPLDALIEKELGASIDTCIDALPEQTRKIFCMSRFENLKYEEIAGRLNVSVDVVKYHIKSALAHLRRELEGYFK